MKRIIFIALLLTACQTANPSGLTQDQAETELLQQGYTDLTIGPSPKGYQGYAMRHGAKINVTIDKYGIIAHPAS